jgi:hypothetical protein
MKISNLNLKKEADWTGGGVHDKRGVDNYFIFER